jgi:hypothetical protein
VDVFDRCGSFGRGVAPGMLDRRVVHHTAAYNHLVPRRLRRVRRLGLGLCFSTPSRIPATSGRFSIFSIFSI